MHKKTIKDVNLAGKTILVSVDYNVALSLKGRITDVYRIEASLPTLKYLLAHNCKIVIISHLGRPHGRRNPKLSLKPVAHKLAELLDRPVHFMSDCVGAEVEQAVAAMKPRHILLLENTRFHPGEEANDPNFAAKLARLGQVFVQDAFGNSHRKHASTVGVPKLLPAVAGLLLAREVKAITKPLKHPKRPFVAIIAGAKVEGKIELLHNLIPKVDTLVIGGAMANTFFLDPHYKLPIGKSVHEDHMQREVAEVITAVRHKLQINGKVNREQLDSFLVMPFYDVAVAKAIDVKAKRREISTVDVAKDDYIVDLGIRSLMKIERLAMRAGTIIWNGPFGVTEVPQFATGSVEVAKAIAHSPGETILGGGDTAAFVDKANLRADFDHVSTGGGASLELMAGKKLPAVEALLNKK